ncbi:MAG TPA: DUF2934 domain-containing protein [Thermodesulfovibrionales bacterium]|nr:DUF2934 domain-containing protein [Thermodesulfovibrionales bacterium]
MNIYDEIAKVAHELFMKRGYAHGHDIEDWLAAERIVKARHASKSTEAGGAGKAKKRTPAKAAGEKAAKPARKTVASKAKGTTTRKKKTE